MKSETVVVFEVRMRVPEDQNVTTLQETVREMFRNQFPGNSSNEDEKLQLVVKLKEKRTFYS